MENLTDYYKNITSQAGEDGIIAEILQRMKIEKGNFCEFGSHNGILFANTKVLADKGWNGCYIEASSQHFGKLVENYKNYPNIVCVKSMVGEKNAIGETTKVMEYSLDYLMKKHFDKPLDIISLDTDGGEYEIFRNIKKYIPKLIIIECNPFRHPLDKEYYGYVIGDCQESLFVMNKLAEEKGYKILLWTQNMFFIKKEYYYLFDVSTDLMELFEQGFRRCYVQNSVEARIHRQFTRMSSKRFDFQETQWLRDIHNKYKHEHCKYLDPDKAE